MKTASPKKRAKKQNPDDFMAFDTSKGVIITMDLAKGMTGWAIHHNGKLIGYDAAPIGGQRLWHTYDNMRVRASTILKVAHKMTAEVPHLLVVEDAMKQPGLASRIYEVLYLAVSEIAGRGTWLGSVSGIIEMAVVAPTQVKAATLGAKNRAGTTKADMIHAVMAMYPIGLDATREHPDGDIADAIGVYLAASALGQTGRLRKAP